MTDKLIAHVKADTKAALEANNKTMSNIITTMETTSKGFTDSIKAFNKNLNDTFKKSKTILDNRAQAYHSSMERLFKIDGWRQTLFWLGLCGAILTPIVLILSRFL